MATREAVLVATKGGFVPFDGERPADSGRYVREEYVDTGLVDPADLVLGRHCLGPAFIDDQLDRSLSNLGLGTVDLYYVHNPETQLESRSREEVYGALEARLGGETRAQRAINFARSGPGVTCSLVGMGSPEHVAENVAAGTHEPLGADAFDAVFE
jgi:aryl-alcohol dehydrogenase-like predicted oxidoreductase